MLDKTASPELLLPCGPGGRREQCPSRTGDFSHRSFQRPHGGFVLLLEFKVAGVTRGS